MKIATFGLVIAVLVAISPKTWADEWTTGDKWRQGVYTALHVYDWQQTRQLMNQGGREMNVILGPYPEQSEINQYFAGTLILHYLIVDNLPRRYRSAFQYVTIGLETTVVGHNYSAGVRVTF